VCLGGKHETSADRVTEKTEIFECRRRVGPRARAWRRAATGRPSVRPTGRLALEAERGFYRERAAGWRYTTIGVGVTVRRPDDQRFTMPIGVRGRGRLGVAAARPSDGGRTYYPRRPRRIPVHSVVPSRSGQRLPVTTTRKYTYTYNIIRYTHNTY